MYSRCFKFTLKRPRNNHTAYWSTFCFLKFLLEFFFYIYCKDTLPVQTFSSEAEVLGSLFLLPLKQSLFLGLSIKPKQVKNISTMSIRCGIFKLLYTQTSIDKELLTFRCTSSSRRFSSASLCCFWKWRNFRRAASNSWSSFSLTSLFIAYNL